VTPGFRSRLGRLAYRARDWYTVRTLMVRPPVPLVSFTFDDFPESAYRIGGTILERHHARATYYAALGLMGSTTECGRQFAVHDLHSLVEHGHELACHSFTHLDARTVSSSTYRSDVLRNQAAVSRLLPGVTLHNFSYPFGRTAPWTGRILGRRFRTCRGIAAGINAGQANLNALRANQIYSTHFDRDRLAALIRANEELRGWLVFYTHDIADVPSRFGCTPEQFETVVRLVMESRSRVITVDEAVRTIRGVPAPVPDGAG